MSAKGPTSYFQRHPKNVCGLRNKQRSEQRQFRQQVFASRLRLALAKPSKIGVGVGLAR